MSILVTGAGGFLGRAVVEQLSAEYDNVLGVSRRPMSDIETVVCDLADPAAVQALLITRAPKVVINLAARIDFEARTVSDIYSVNVLCPALLAEYCRRHDAYMVQASSVAVYRQDDTYFGRRTPEDPGTLYGKSKFLAEQMIFAAGCSAAVIRFAGIFGRHGPEHLGLNRAINLAAKGEIPTLVGSGSARRNYIFVRDAAAMIAVAVTKRLTGVFHAAGETVSIADMLHAVCDEWLPGQVPCTTVGSDARDQVVEISPELGPYRSFRDALRVCQ